MRKALGGLAGIVAVATVATAMADSVTLKNPGFEAGSLRAWKTLEDGGGNWFVYKRGESYPEFKEVPPRGFAAPQGKYPRPPQGQRAAILTQETPGLNILHRVLRPKSDASKNKLSFQLYYRNFGEDWSSPKSFDYGDDVLIPVRSGPKQPDPNQQVRIDLLKRDARVKSLKGADILATVLRTRNGDPKRRRWEPLRINLTKLGIDKPFRLRIAEVDNQGYVTVAVDALKLKFKP